MLEALADGVPGHRRHPQPLDRLVHRQQLADVLEDQLTLAAGVTAVHDLVHVLAPGQLAQHVQLLLAAPLDRLQVEFVGDDRQPVQRPQLVLGVVVLGLGQLDQVAHRPGHDEVVRLEVVGLCLKGPRKRLGVVLANGRLLGYDERFSHSGRRG